MTDKTLVTLGFPHGGFGLILLCARPGHAMHPFPPSSDLGNSLVTFQTCAPAQLTPGPETCSRHAVLGSEAHQPPPTEQALRLSHNLSAPEHGLQTSGIRGPREPVRNGAPPCPNQDTHFQKRPRCSPCLRTYHQVHTQPPLPPRRCQKVGTAGTPNEQSRRQLSDPPGLTRCLIASPSPGDELPALPSKPL